LAILTVIPPPVGYWRWIAPVWSTHHIRLPHSAGRWGIVADIRLPAESHHYCGRMSVAREPVAFELYESGVYLHGTKADLAVGEMPVPGRESNFEEGRVMNYVYFTATLDAATWGAELASGAGRGRIYIVDPMGEFEDDPNVTDKRFPGNPTQSFRTREPLRVIGELDDWVGHSPEKLQAMRDGLEALRREGAAQIED
jgi:rifampin ADP-ribosylating transferase